nr:reverse transcriptase domain-containing protein [Tanacetum cinerariifolium]
MADNRTMAEMLRAPTEGTTSLRNEISNFQQRFDVSFHEAWDRYKDLLRACPHHGFTELHQLDTFYNALNLTDQDSLNAAAGGNLLEQSTQDVLTIIKNKSKVRNYRSKPIASPVKACDINSSSEIAKLTHAVNEQTSARCSSVLPVSCCRWHHFPRIQTSLSNQINEIKNMMASLLQMNTASTSSSGTLPSKTVSNPKSNLKAITTRSGVSYDGPSIPPPVVEKEPEATKDIVIPTNNGANEDVQPQVVQSKPVTFEPANTPVSVSKPNPQASIPYPSRRNDERNLEKAKDQIEKFYQIFKDMSFEISFADALILMPKFASTLKALIGNKEKLREMARTPMNEHCSAVLLKKLPEKLGDPGKFLISCDFPGMAKCLALADLSASINRMPYSVWKKLSLPELTPTCMTLELADRTIFQPVGVAEDTERALIDVFEEDKPIPFYDILLLEAFLNDDPSPPPPNQRNYIPEVRKELKICEAKTDKSLVDEPPTVELKALPLHLEYAFLEGDDKLPVIIKKDLTVEEKVALITVLKSHKQAIAWKLSDIKGINPKFYNHKILLEEDFTLAVQHQRRVNPKIYDVIKQEVIKLLDAGLIYPISNSSWVSPVHYVPKKGGFTVVENEENELIPNRLVTRWRVCIDYRKLNEAIWKDHFPLPFMYQMLERLAGN